MLTYLFTQPFFFLIWLTALALAVAVHEFAHAWAADRLGDPTPRLAGRLTLNPLAHLDPLGTLMLLIARIGWGKPVPVDPFNLRHPRRDSALISLAGPAANLLFALLLSLLLRLTPSALLFLLLTPLLVLNVSLAVFNLIPIPPLDGAKIFLGLLPPRQAAEWENLFRQYATLLLFLLIVPFGGVSLAERFITPIIHLILSLLLPSAAPLI